MLEHLLQLLLLLLLLLLWWLSIKIQWFSLHCCAALPNLDVAQQVRRDVRSCLGMRQPIR
jgi:hypothetical protein